MKRITLLSSVVMTGIAAMFLASSCAGSTPEPPARGGTTNHWGGHSIVINDHIFGPRAGVPGGTWPFGSDELRPYYVRASEILWKTPAVREQWRPQAEAGLVPMERYAELRGAERRLGLAGTVLQANQALLDLLGYAHEDYVGLHVSEVHAHPEVVADMLAALANRDTLTDCSARLRCQDGSIRDVLINANAYWKGAGSFTHTVSSGTSRKSTDPRLSIRRCSESVPTPWR